MDVWKRRQTYKVCEVNVTLCVQQDVVRLDISVYYAHVMYVFQCAAQLRNPEAHRLFCECFSRNVKAKVTARHEIDDKVSIQPSACCLKSRWCKDSQVLDVLETVSKVAEKGMIKVLEHASLANDVPDAL
jgi:hypothetical protein